MLVWVTLLGWVTIIGVVLGVITAAETRRIMRNKVGPIWVTTLLGVTGSVVGLFGARFLAEGVLRWYPPLWTQLTILLTSAVIGAIALIWLYSLIKQSLAHREKGNATGEGTTIEATPRTHPTNTGPFEIPKRDTGVPVAIPTGADIFVSYASPDRPTALALASALQGEGWSVWWDRTIPPCKTFDDVIEAALNRAKCVVVLWSKTAVTSEWVKAEAAEAVRRRILIPALIEEVTIPLEFRRIQAASLVGWSGSRPHPGFQSLVRSITDLCNPSVNSPSG